VLAVHDGSGPLPKVFALNQNSPNPFNPTTVISYQLPVASDVKLVVFNILGREVATLVDGVEEPGYKSVKWDARDVTSRVYFCRLQARPAGGGQAGDLVQVKKPLIVK
jgi:hypothetical protein